jgi:NAD-dependent dihydropyrimidine dehydrogenase PreA subunit
MRIDPADCIGCDVCLSYCPVEAIERDGDVAVIDDDACVECGTCMRVDRCPTDAFYMQELAYPRTVRQVFSDPTAEHEETTIAGRGTEEMKTNDVTERIDPGEVGINVELGRPGISTTFAEVETVTTAIAEAVEFEAANPLTSLMSDPETGEFKAEVLDERALSAIVEVAVDAEDVPEMFARLEDAVEDLDTVASFNLSLRLDEGETLLDNVLHDVLEDTDVELSINGKTNVGLGKTEIKRDVPSRPGGEIA